MLSLKTQNWQINEIETILFDKDGTFIDLHYFWGKMTELRAFSIIEKYNLSKTDLSKICLFLGYNPETKKMIPDGITALYSRSKIIELFQKELLSLNINVSKEELETIFDNVSQDFYKNIETYTKPIDSAIEFIKKLHSKNIKLGIVTSDSIESTNLTIKQFGWEKFFDVVIGRESSPYTKESGEPTKLALDKLNANPKTTLMIGDAPMDYISAKNAGIDKIILVATGQISKEELLKTTNFVVSTLDEIQS